MVGIPRRVGCQACKKRRLKCNHERPQCIHCKQDGRKCEYPGMFTFVVNDPGSHRTIYRRPASKKHDVVTFPGHGDTCKSASSPESSYAAAWSSCTIGNSQMIYQFPRMISTIDLTNQQFLSHAIHHFATTGTATQPSADLTFFQTWVTTLQDPTSTCTPLKASSLACCAAWFARNDQNPSMIDYSRHLYTQGLQEVREALRVPKLVLEDETLGACLALTVFEVSECPGQSRAAYDWHRRANLNLLRLRGAKRHREGVGHELFLAARLHGIFHAYDRRTPNFLCTRDWLTIPWQNKPKDDFHRLADVLARGPQLLLEADNLYKAHKPLNQTFPALITLLSKLLDIDQELVSFYTEIETRNETDGPLYWKERNQTKTLTFRNPRTASLLTLYWSIQTLLYSSLSILHAKMFQTNTLRHLSQDSSDPRIIRFHTLCSAPSSAPSSYWLESVRKVLATFEYCMRESAGSATPPAGMGVALEIVIDILQQRRSGEKAAVEGEGGVDFGLGGVGGGGVDGGGGCQAELEQAREAREVMGRRWVAIMLA